MGSYAITATTTSSNLNIPLQSTMIKVTSTAACWYNINGDCYGNTGASLGMIPANQTVYINTLGLNNILAVNAVSGTAQISVVECGTVYQSAMNQNSTTYLNP